MNVLYQVTSLVGIDEAHEFCCSFFWSVFFICAQISVSGSFLSLATIARTINWGPKAVDLWSYKCFTEVVISEFIVLMLQRSCVNRLLTDCAIHF